MEARHEYRVKAVSTIVRSGVLMAEGIEPVIPFSAPPEFHGQAGHWTPEHFFVSAVASCYLSTFSGGAEVYGLPFVSFDLEAEGFLGKDEGGRRFTEVVLRPHLMIAREEDRERADRLLQKAGKSCLVARSLNCRVTLEPVIKVEEALLVVEKN
jgi:organic hydroperoxide reductase OsmC/OhrA